MLQPLALIEMLRQLDDLNIDAVSMESKSIKDFYITISQDREIGRTLGRPKGVVPRMGLHHIHRIDIDLAADTGWDGNLLQ